MKTNPLVSVIVPVYNVETFLKRCIDSILAQTYQNFELLLVDDGSRDKSGEICDDYAAKDHRVHVFHQENKGVSSARNFALKNIRGGYVIFCDSDDWIDSSYIDDFNFLTHDADLYIQGAIYEVNSVDYSYRGFNEKFCSNVNEVKMNFFNQGLDHYGYPWGKLFKADIIGENDLIFEERMSTLEDSLFYFRYMCYVKQMYVTNKYGYHYLCIDNTKRKLSDKSHSSEEYELVSTSFANVISKMSIAMRLQMDFRQDLEHRFVVAPRFKAIMAMVMDCDMVRLNEKRNFWRKYKAASNREKITKLMLSNKFLPLSMRVHILKLLYRIIEKRKQRNFLKQVYEDLNRRSTPFK